MKILVTGATGFIGSHVTRALVEAGGQVRILRRRNSPLELIEGLEVDDAIGDILDPASLPTAFQGIEGVVHCAAQMRGSGGPAPRLASHERGTRNTLSAATATSVRRYVYISSVAALGIPEQSPAEDDHAVRPMDETHSWRGPASAWPYGFAKHQAEQSVARASRDGLGALTVNPALVIGPGDRNRVSNILIWHILNGRVPPMVAGGLNVVAVEDVAAGVTAALARGRAGERYILGGQNRTLADLIQTTARLLGKRPPRWRLPLGATRAVARVAAGAVERLRLPVAPELLRQAGIYFYYTTEKAQQELGLAPPRPYEAAAESSAAWYRHHPVR